MKIDKLNKKQKQRIIFENFNNPIFQVSLKKLQEVKQELNVPLFNFKSSNKGCGDIIYFLIKNENDYVKSAFFATDQQACCLTIASANILCNWIKNKKKEEVRIEIVNFEKMIEKSDHQPLKCKDLEAFQDLNKFPSRLECVSLVTRAIKHLI